MDPYQELTIRLRRSDLLLLRAVRRQRARPPVRAKGQFWGSVITDDEVDELLAAHGEIPAVPEARGWLDGALQSSELVRDAPGGRIGELRARNGLDGLDIDLLLLALLPDVSAGYGRIFAYLNDNLNQPWLTVDLASRVLATLRRERLGVLARLLPAGRLLKRGLIELAPVGGVNYHASLRVEVSRQVLFSLLDGEPAAQEAGPVLHLVGESEDGEADDGGADEGPGPWAREP